MDPKACLARLLSALDDQDAVESIAASADLLVWLLSVDEIRLATPGQCEQIALGLAQLADRVEDAAICHGGL